MNALPIIISTVVASAGVVAYARFKLKHAAYITWRDEVLATIRVTPDREKERREATPPDADWAADDFYSAPRESRAFQSDHLTAAKRKTEKLAALARYIEDANALRLKRKAQKKSHRPIERAMQMAMRERLEIERGTRDFNGTSWELV